MFNEAAGLEKSNSVSTQKQKREADPRFWKMLAGNTYRCRLVFKLTTGYARKSPFIIKEIHKSYGISNIDASVGETPSWITCPTSPHIMGPAGFKSCPICNEVSKWYKSQEVSQHANKMYNIFRRQKLHFALVLVLQDPTNQENVGKLKILKYNNKIHEFFRWNIFGDHPKNAELVNEDRLGVNAFDFNEGYDLIFSIAKNKFPGRDGKEIEFDQKNPSFARKATALPQFGPELEEQFAQLRFDEDFYTVASQEDLIKWHQYFVVPNMIDIKSVGNSKIDSEYDTSVISTESNNITEDFHETVVKPTPPPTPTPKPTPSIQTVAAPAPQTPQKASVPTVKQAPAKIEVDEIDEIMKLLDGIGD